VDIDEKNLKPTRLEQIKKIYQWNELKGITA
jgi:hypothetical protein